MSQIENKNSKNKVNERLLSGIVISDKMDKTIVVRVDRFVRHKKYKKQYKISSRYKVHDSESKFKEGDKVFFQGCRPLSKDKRWKVIYNN